MDHSSPLLSELLEDWIVQRLVVLCCLGRGDGVRLVPLLIPLWLLFALRGRQERHQLQHELVEPEVRQVVTCAGLESLQAAAVLGSSLMRLLTLDDCLVFATPSDAALLPWKRRHKALVGGFCNNKGEDENELVADTGTKINDPKYNKETVP